MRIAPSFFHRTGLGLCLLLVCALGLVPTAQALMLDVAAAGPRWVAVGDRGSILLSDDQGSTWQPAQVTGKQMLTAVAFVDDRRGWAAGHDAQIWATADGGQSWTLQHQDPSREAPLLDLWFWNPRLGYAIGAYGTVLATSDGGQTWMDVSERLPNPEQLHLNAIAETADGSLFIVGERGIAFRSPDRGQTWEKLDVPYEGSLFGLLPLSQPGGLLAFGLRGQVLRSTDAGERWLPIEVSEDGAALEPALAGGTLAPDGSLILVGHGGVILHSENAGRSFQVTRQAHRRALSAVAANCRGELILAGERGVRLLDIDGGAAL